MNPWGVVMVLIGGLMVLGGATRSNFVLYQLLAARARLLWGDRVHAFMMVAGVMVAIAGVLVAL
jgi:hypothetical protein